MKINKITFLSLGVILLVFNFFLGHLIPNTQAERLLSILIILTLGLYYPDKKN